MTSDPNWLSDWWDSGCLLYFGIFCRPTRIFSILNMLEWLALVILVAWMIRKLFSQHYRFQNDYSEHSNRLKRYLGQFEADADRLVSPGHSYVVASQGPTHSQEAELQSASARWHHFSIAFPEITAPSSDPRDIILISVPSYPREELVSSVQDRLKQSIHNRFEIGERHVIDRDIGDLDDKEFDAIRNPQLAIATPTIYLFPFLLTWQRRHQWGVLPYATHTLLGVVVREDHPKREQLAEIEKAYKAKAGASGHASALWLNNRDHARWLPMLLEAADDSRASVRRDRWPEDRPGRVYSAGAYLHKELLPLMCAMLGDRKAATSFATNAREIKVSDITSKTFFSKALRCWMPSCAVVVDLAFFSTNDLPNGTYHLFRLPHSVYVPVGVGFSILALPLFITEPGARQWWNAMLQDIGQMLLDKKPQLSELGIELDERLWKKNSV